jgi:hypothetical protein
MPKRSPAKVPLKDPRAVPLKVFVEARKAVRSQWARAEKRNGGARAVLTAFLAAHFEFLNADARTAQALYDPPPETANERTRLERLKTIRALMNAAEKAVAAGKREKAVRGDVDPAMAAVHFLGAIQMAWTFWTIGGRRGDLTDAGLRLFDQLWDGISV